MRVKQAKPVDGRVTLDITADAQEVDAAIAYLVAKCAAENSVSPSLGPDLEFALRAKVGGDYLQAYLDSQLPVFLASQAVGQERIQTLLNPEVVGQPPQAERGKPMAFAASVLLKPQYTLSSYEPVSLKLQPIVVSEAEIDEQVYMLAEQFATYIDQPSDSAAGAGEDAPDAAAGAGEAAPEAAADTAGAPAADAPAGTSAPSDTPAAQATSPAPSSAKVIPAITDAWVAENIPNASTVPELRELIRANSLLFKQAEQQEFIAYAAAAELARRLEGEISQEVFDLTRDDLLASLQGSLDAQGRTLAEFIESQGGEEAFTAQMALQTREVLRQGFALDALARHLGLVVTSADIEDAFARMAPGHEEIAYLDFRQTGRMYVMEEAALRIKANLWLVENAIIEYLDEDAGAASGDAPGAAAGGAEGEE